MSVALEKASVVGYSGPEDVLSAEKGKRCLCKIQDIIPAGFPARICQGTRILPWEMSQDLGIFALVLLTVVSLSFLLLYHCDGFGEPGRETKAFSNHFAKINDCGYQYQ